MSTHVGDNAAELGSILREGQQVTDGAADSVDAVRWFDLFDQHLREHQFEVGFKGKT